MDRIAVVGVGPGPGNFLLPAAREAIAGADILAGGPRHLEPYRESGKELLSLEGSLDAFLDRLEEKRNTGKVALLLSGDPCFYSLLGKLGTRFAPEEMEVVPGVSSFQVLFARLGIQWNGTETASLHGRPLDDALKYLREDRGTLFLLDRKNTGPAVAAFLKDRGFPDRPAVLAENLGYPEERILRTTLFGLAGEGQVGELALLLLGPGSLPPGSLGVLPDEWFVRAPGVPLSKAACRALVTSLLHPLDGQAVLEIGAGSGGITVELGRRTGTGTVFAVERSADALAAARKNAERAGCLPVRFVGGQAPEALASLPRCTRVVVGGHGGAVEAVIEAAWEKLLPGGRLLATANMPSTADRAWKALKSLGSRPEVLHIAPSSSAEAGGSWMLTAANPVFLVYADRNADKDGSDHEHN
ncbi:precorrin-6y C5,15-methyltransferase (decarboxylating) subunit CbiE [Aminivibrio sp.]|jgi:precorrin-6Y C5,15-methyltransferase (decarboxylating)|uniref:precorrin-6y C5,15-methyltransferase (decarboxylating) subunit CbiE n=1 Tax=Aminivibrio sp. TaxID=1872489 RepID=UPI001A475B8E|nr:precorrin-6y C5,15-methyltransferase (decarboxylating) subunit CbiE [Aminivibrio sp.]MBL3540471.1 precorrin-6y C5,15-methyltransferase (decarboxylating) subunit CbiE [Aminivibrio sp.]